MTRVLAAILLVVVGASAWYGVWRPLFETGRKLGTWTPVEVVRTTKIGLRQRGPNLKGLPAASTVSVVYRYQLGDNTVILPPKENPPTHEIGPIFQQHAEKMEQALRNGLPMPAGPDEVSDKINGYANPTKPDELYFHHPKSQLLFPLLLPLIVLIVSVMGLLVGRPHTNPRVPQATKTPPWRRLTQVRTTQRAIIENVIIATAWGAMVSFVCSMYFRVHRPPSTEALVSATVFGAATLVPLLLAILYAWVMRKVRQPMVEIDESVLTVGEPVTVRLRQPFRSRTELDWLRLGLLCMKEHTHHRRAHRSTDIACLCRICRSLAHHESVEANATLKCEQKFQVPADAEPSTPPKEWNTLGSLFFMRHFSWYVRVELKLPKLPSLKADFPVRVE